MSKFSDYWKASLYGIEKSKLTKGEIVEVREKISQLQSRGLSSSKIISELQKMPKLSERWKAERAYWTESKRDDSELVGDAGEDLGLTEYKVILSPSACPFCVKKTDNGSKIFKQTDIEKGGYGHIPPFHPNCYCITIPVG